MPPATAGYWLAAAAPVIVLLVVATTGLLRTRTASILIVALTVLLSFTVFGADGHVLAVAMGKGLWLGAWILYVVFPAMLLYRLAERAGFDRIGNLFAHLFPNRAENLLVLAWLLPSFVQGVAGFGTPIAVAAPLLLASGWSRACAIAYPLIAYNWSVTFGSMGSSFYMAALTAHLDQASTTEFAHHASLMLGANALIGGALVLVIDGGLRGLREGAGLLLMAGVPMVLTLYAVTSVVPAIGTVAAGAVGFASALIMAYVRRTHRSARDSVGFIPVKSGWLVSPYLYLLGIALAVLLVPRSRAWAESHFVFGPDFGATATGLGFASPAVSDYTPLRLFTHPGSYLLVACGLGYLTYRLVGLWSPRPAMELLRGWFASVRTSAVSIVALACVTTLLIEAGMVSTLARGAVAATGSAYPALSGLIGALGSFLTGSTTSSNALFSALQAKSAELLHMSQPVLLAAQTAGANVGNSVSPVVVLIGIGAVGGRVRPHDILKLVLPASALLLAVITAITLGSLIWA